MGNSNSNRAGQGKAGPSQPHTYEFPSCGGQGLFLSCLAHPGRVFPSNDALFLHPAISAEECDVLSEAETPKPPLWLAAWGPKQPLTYLGFSWSMFVHNDMMNLEGRGSLGEGRALSQASPLSRAEPDISSRGCWPSAVLHLPGLPGQLINSACWRLLACPLFSCPVPWLDHKSLPYSSFLGPCSTHPEKQLEVVRVQHLEPNCAAPILLSRSLAGWPRMGYLFSGCRYPLTVREKKGSIS